MMYKKVNNTSASLMKNQFITKKRVKGFLENEFIKRNPLLSTENNLYNAMCTT